MREDMPRPVETSVPTGAAAVGQMLREARESLGMTLEQVAEDTRIRQHLLDAIEAGRFGDLPGSAYAPAFLRGYAACVGLDVDRVLQVYRSADNQAAPPPPALHFPVVPPERRVPRGAMMLASAVLLVCAYVTWHALTRDQQTEDVRVPPVPQRLLADQKPVVPAGEPASPPQTVAPSVPPAAAPPADPASAPAAPGSTTPPSTAGAVPPPAAPPATPPATAAVPPAPAAAAPPPTTATAAPPVMPALPNTPPAIAPEHAPPPASTAGDVKPGTGAPQVAARPPAVPAAPGRPATTGQTATDGVTAADNDPTQGNRVTSRRAPPPPSRPAALPPAATAGADAPPQQATAPVSEPPRPAARPRVVSAPVAPQARTVRAEVNSTLQLKGADGEVLATTYLRAGSTYTVPEHVGYVLVPVQ